MSLVYNVFYNLAKLIARCLFSMRVVHAERMIEEGPLILAVNHSSYLDPPLAGIRLLSGAQESAGVAVAWAALSADERDPGRAGR